MSWAVYIVQCMDGTLYTGCSTDVTRRVWQHNRGKGAKYTRSRLPVRLLKQWPAMTRSKALRLEARIKKLPRSQKFATLRSESEILPEVFRPVTRWMGHIRAMSGSTTMGSSTR